MALALLLVALALALALGKMLLFSRLSGMQGPQNEVQGPQNFPKLSCF